MSSPRFVFLAVTGLLACGTADQATSPEGADLPTGPLATTRFSTWFAPTNLGPVVNSPFVDFTPEISKDGLSLYFASDRPGGMSPAPDIWVSQRQSRQDPWGPPVNLGSVVNSAGADAAPNLSRNGHQLFFTSTRPGGSGLQDIWVSWRNDIHNDFAWEVPINLGPAVNSPAFDAGPAMLRPELYFTSNRATGDPEGLDVYVSVMQGNVFRAAMLVTELSSDENDLRPTIRIDGREIFLSSDRAGSVASSQDIWVSTRRSREDRWTVPQNLGSAVNSEATEQQPALSDDATTLYFSSDRLGGSGSLDLWVTTRE